MNLLERTVDFLLGGPKVGGADEHRLNLWRSTRNADLTRPHSHQRYVVVDTETTGVDLKRDRLIAIGAVAVERNRIALHDCFETVLRQDKASGDANILVHRIGGQTQLSGVEPRAGMLAFLEFLGKSPLVAFRAEFDQTMIERGMRSILGLPFHHPWIDLAFLLPALNPGTECRALDDWLRHFRLAGGERHRALGDAFATAQLLQIALVAADRVEMGDAAQLIAMQKAQRWLGRR
ncbi:MAG: 3'-5' exonuclease [Burkholderiales bacterium]